MSLTIRYIAALRDQIGKSEEVIDQVPATGAALVQHLAAQDPAARLLAEPFVRLIVNDAVVPMDTALKDGDIIAFCPPFSGG